MDSYYKIGEINIIQPVCSSTVRATWLDSEDFAVIIGMTENMTLQD